MRINNDCIKAILNFVIENTGIDCDDTKFSIKQTNLNQIVKTLNEDFDQKVIIHSTIYANKCGYLDMKPIKEISNIIYTSCDIADITPLGYKFLEDVDC